MTTAKANISQYIPTNFTARKQGDLVIFQVNSKLMELTGGCVKVAMRYPTVRPRDGKVVARLELAMIAAASAPGEKGFKLAPFDTSMSGKGAVWVNIKANNTATSVIATAARLSRADTEVVQTWSENSCHEGQSNSASLRLIPLNQDSHFEFTTKINVHPTTGALAKMPIGIDKFVFTGKWSLVDSDSQTLGDWGEAIPVEKDEDLLNMDLSSFGVADSELAF